MANALEPGAGGLAAPSPADNQAVSPLNLPPPAPSPMMQHYGSHLEEAAAKFAKVKDVQEKAQAWQKELDKLTALGDTVTTDDIVNAAAVMVAAGLPAVQVAGTLATMPEQPSQLPAWVQEHQQKLQGQEQQVVAALAATGFDLGRTALKHIIAISAEAHHQRRALAGMPVQGRA